MQANHILTSIAKKLNTLAQRGRQLAAEEAARNGKVITELRSRLIEISSPGKEEA